MTVARRVKIELKADDSDPAEIVAKALSELKDSVDGRLKVIETKSVDAVKLTDRLDKIEAKLNRPANDNNGQPMTRKLKRKAFAIFVRGGREAMGADEIKSLITGDDPRGGYFAPPQFSTDMIRHSDTVFASARCGSRRADCQLRQ